MHKRNGFTLIELLVVIAIIALLMSILMPALQKVKTSAKAVICQNNLHQWAIAFGSYADEHNGTFWSGDINAGLDQYTWCIPLREYYSNETDMLFCPMATKLRGEGAVDPYAAWGPLMWASELNGSYGMNNWCTNPPPDMEFIHSSEPTKNNWRNVYNLKNANKIPLFLDCAYIECKPYDTDGPPEYEGDISEYMVSGKQIKRFCMNRHDGYVNGLFLDFSIRKVGLKELWTLKWHKYFDTSNYWTTAGGVQPEDWPEWMRGFKDY
ncbi:MAG: type II secretion system protein [Sedimentisphaerales bacterium]|nr:type II secretion system protein [Sedimentisphaerales bacterium]